MRTALWDRHVALGAKMVDFAGYDMPLQYKGILHEHHAVRQNAGLFDVSHMGRVSIQGSDAFKFIDFISTQKIRGPGRATYTCICYENGGVVDDALIYCESPTSYFVVLNASRKEADLEHLSYYAKNYDVSIQRSFENEGILALQGPNAAKYFSEEAAALKPMQFKSIGDLIVSATGYTGSGGIEIFGPTNRIVEVWDTLLSKGVEPIGLGARDTLRLEKGYALYGHELSKSICPMESVSAWTVSFEKEFIGKEGVYGQGRSMYGLLMEGAQIPREGYKVFEEDEEIGTVTSGGFSPSLKLPIALILCKRPQEMGKRLAVEIRGKKLLGKIVPLPFI